MNMLNNIIAFATLMAHVRAQSTPAYTFYSGIQLRYQWWSNDGYCGETSLIEAGLKYGQYMSQYDVRAVGAGAAPPQDGKTIQDSQLLLGMNDWYYASAMKLASKSFPHDYPDLPNNPPVETFLAWLKKVCVFQFELL